MNILSVSSILPLPGFAKSNDFVLHSYKAYKTLYPNDEVVIIRPVKYDLLKFISGKATLLNKLNKQFSGEIHGFKVFILPFFSSWRCRNLHAFLCHTLFFLNRKKLKQLIKKYAFDLTHAQFIFPDGLLAYNLSKFYKIPYLITTHNERFYFDHLLSNKLALKLLINASKVLPINYTNYVFLKSFGLNNVVLIPLGFNTSFLRAQNTDIKDTVRIVTIAELIKLKNIDKVLHALTLLDRKENFTYTIIGSGPEKERLQQLVILEKLENLVHFIEYIPHEKIADELYQYDILIMPSYFETFGRVYFEAMAMGIPIICAKESGIYGLFKEMKEGISVNHQDIREIAQSLDFLIKNPEKRRDIGFQGQQLVKNYTWEKIAELLREQYHNSLTSLQ